MPKLILSEKVKVFTECGEDISNKVKLVLTEQNIYKEDDEKLNVFYFPHPVTGELTLVQEVLFENGERAQFL